MSQELCPVCHNPCSRKNGNGAFNATCGKPECYRRLAQLRAEEREGWPTITGAYFPPNAFAHNVTTKPYGHVPMRPETHVETISTAGMLVREAS